MCILILLTHTDHEKMHKQVSSALHDMHQPILYLLLKISICIKSIKSCLSVKNLIHFWKNKYLAIFLYQKEKNYFFFLSLKNLKGKKKTTQQIKHKNCCIILLNKLLQRAEKYQRIKLIQIPLTNNYRTCYELHVQSIRPEVSLWGIRVTQFNIVPVSMSLNRNIYAGMIKMMFIFHSKISRLL